MIEAYKHVKGTYSVDIPCIKLEDPCSRGHVFKLKEKRAAMAIRLNFFSLRINNTWKRLRSHVVGAPSINSFKAKHLQTVAKIRYTKSLVS